MSVSIGDYKWNMRWDAAQRGLKKIGLVNDCSLSRLMFTSFWSKRPSSNSKVTAEVSKALFDWKRFEFCWESTCDSEGGVTSRCDLGREFLSGHVTSQLSLRC